MKKFIKSIILCFSSAVLVFSQSCSDGKKSTSNLTEEDVTVWGAPVTEKILQDLPMEEAYASVKRAPDINILMAKGEYEGAQVIVSPKKDVPYYNVSVSELRHTDGEATISKENIGIYQQKYLPVTVSYNRSGVPFGMYPDAILPFSATVEYEENKITKDLNQGIYVNFETEIDQPTGIYTGSMTIDFESFQQVVPIQINVVNAVVSEENNARSCVLNHWTYQHGELNSTQEMRDAYTDALVEYRLAPSAILNENDHSASSIQAYVEKAWEYMQNPRFSNLSIPYKNVKVEYEPEGKLYDCIDPDTFEAYLYAFAEKSFATNYNMAKKLVVYNAIIDEPDDRGMTSIVRLNAKVFNTTVKKVADALEADATITSSVKAEFIEDLRNLPHIVTNRYKADWGMGEEGVGDEYINTFCPLTNAYNSESERKNYAKQNEQWWYVCNNPYWPYPNWQIEDVDFLAPRVMGWMQAEYDIQGVLYWGCNEYSYYDIGTKEYVCVEDYYGANAKRTRHNSSGEGFLFYPGGQYGLDKPVGSLRLEAIRDGLEEYELLLSLKNKYKELGFSADSLTKTMNALLYTGAQVSSTSENYAKARESLLALCSVVESPAGMCIIDSVDEGNGKVVNKVFVKSGWTLKKDGVAVQEGVLQGDGYIYTVETVLSSDNNQLNLSVEKDGVVYTYTQDLGGKVTVVPSDTLAGGFKSNNVTVATSVVAKSTIGQGDGNTVKAELSAAAADTSQRIKLELSAFNDLSEKSKKIVLKIYNPTETDIKVVVDINFTNSIVLKTKANTTLKAKAYTLVEVDVGSTVWNDVGKLKDFYITFGEKSKEKDALTLYVDNVVVYDK